MAESSNSTLFGMQETFNLLGADLTLLTIIVTMLIIVAGFVVAHTARAVMIKYIGTRLPPDARKSLGRTLYYVIIAIGLLSALGYSGVDLSGLFLAGGIAGIIIGFATQSLFSNLISGIFLHLDKPMKIGDPVLITGKLPDVAGVVVEITALSSRLRMFDGTYVRLPNSDVFLSEIQNFSGAAARRVEFTVGVSYKEDIYHVINIIHKSLQETPLVLVEPEPDLYVDNLGDSSVNINVWCWTPFSVWFDTKKQLVSQIKVALDAAGIEIPFPQRVVYLRQDTGAPKSGAPLSSNIKSSLNLEEYSNQD